jgi:hypothetical protein
VDLDERRRFADANVVAAFTLTQRRLRDPRGETMRYGAVHAVAVGVDIPFFNPVLALDPESRPRDVLDAIAWVEAKGLPVSVQVWSHANREVRAAVEELGLVAGEWAMPVMMLEPIPAAPPAPDGIAIRTGGAELFDDWHTAIQSSERFRRVFGPALVADPGVRLAVGYLAGVPVSGAAVIRSERTIGIYSVWTVAAARRRGLGRAVTWAGIDAGRAAWSSVIAVLQSSEMGVPVYRSMGFEEIGSYIEFERPKVQVASTPSGAAGRASPAATR